MEENAKVCEVCFELIPLTSGVQQHSHDAVVAAERHHPQLGTTRKALVAAAKAVVANNSKKTSTGFIQQMEAYVNEQNDIRARHMSGISMLMEESSCLGQDEVIGAWKQMREEIHELRKRQDKALVEDSAGAVDLLMEDYKTEINQYKECYESIYQQQKKRSESSLPPFPWRASYLVETLSAKLEGTVEFEGGVITDRNGNLIWDSVCEYCGIVVQRGAYGSGLSRVVRFDEGCIGCVDCFTKLSSLPSSNFFPGKDPVMDVQELTDQVSLRVEMLRDAKHLGHMVWNALNTHYSGRPAVGCFQAKPDGATSYRWTTYGEIGTRCTVFARYLNHIVLPHVKKAAACSPSSSITHPLLGVSSQNREEFLVADIASVFAGWIEVGIHTTYLEEELVELIEHNGLSVFVADSAQVQRLSKILRESPKSIPSISCVICMDDVDLQHKNFLFPTRVMCETMSVVLQRKELQDSTSEMSFALMTGTPMDPARRDEEWSWVTVREEGAYGGDNLEELPGLCSIIYTSGSTGSPKGCLTTERSFRSDVSHGLNIFPLVTISYIPLSHSTDRMRLYETLLNGGRCGFAEYAHKNWESHELHSGESRFQLLRQACELGGTDNGVSEILENVQHLRPTVFIAPPRIWKGLEFLMKALLTVERTNKGTAENSDLDLLAKHICQTWFGARVQSIATGGGPTDTSTFEFTSQFFGLPLLESYGCTEGGAIAIGTDGAGAFMPLVDGAVVRLAPGSSPTYGELLVHTPTLSLGYWKNRGQSSESFVELPLNDSVHNRHRFFRTGDMCEVQRDEQEGGSLGVIKAVRVRDRKKAVVLTSSGEEISLEAVECALADKLNALPAINNSISHCAAIVSNTGNLVGTITHFVLNSTKAHPVLEGYNSIKQTFFSARGLPSAPSCIVDSDVWSPNPQNRLRGMLTVSLKVNRAAVAKKFSL